MTCRQHTTPSHGCHRQRLANTVALLQTCENCKTTNAKPYYSAEVAAQVLLQLAV